MPEPGGSPLSGPPPGPPGRPLPPAPPAARRSAWWIPVTGVVVLVAAIGAVIAIAQAAGDGTPDDPPAARATTGDPPATAVASAPVRTAPPAPTDGVRFEDPDGSYTMTIDAEWADMSTRMAAGTEAWAIGQGAAGFTPNVNVLTQAARGLDLDAYLATSVNSLDTIDGELIEQSYVQGAGGAMLGSMRYSATPAGSAGPLEFLAVFDVRNDTAVVATLTATVDTFDALAIDVEPYLLTLETTG